MLEILELEEEQQHLMPGIMKCQQEEEDPTGPDRIVIETTQGGQTRRVMTMEHIPVNNNSRDRILGHLQPSVSLQGEGGIVVTVGDHQVAPGVILVRHITVQEGIMVGQQVTMVVQATTVEQVVIVNTGILVGPTMGAQVGATMAQGAQAVVVEVVGQVLTEEALGTTKLNTTSR